MAIYQKRISCANFTKDIGDSSSNQQALFWIANKGTSWFLTARLLYKEDISEEEKLREIQLLNLGSGTYGGIFVFGSRYSNWNIVYSFNNEINIIRYNQDLTKILFFNSVTYGTYPIVFHLESVDNYMITFFDAGAYKAVFTGDWLNFSRAVSLFDIESIWDMYKMYGTEVTLRDHIEVMDYAKENSYGYQDGYLSHPYSF